MEKIFDFIDDISNYIEKHSDIIMKCSYVIINALGSIITLTCFFCRQWAAFALILFFTFFEYLGIALAILTILFVINIAAFFAVKNNQSVLGVIFSLLCGSIGGFSAAYFTNENFAKAKALKLIFNIQMWIIVWIVLPSILFFNEYYSIAGIL